MARVLCVDDDVQVLELKRTILERAGHGVDVSSSVEEALKRLEEGSYDAVITDWWFGPHDALRVIQKAKASAAMPVLVVSGFVAEALVSLGTGADIYLEKPVNAVELTSALDKLIAEGKQRQKTAA
jgi:DNA-binding response OmpR family regulator